MILVFGGSFNPPTKAHLNIINKLLSIYPDSQVLILPVGNHYLKPELVDIKHRLKMLEIMTESLKQISISDLEAYQKFQGTFASLNELSKTYKDIHFVIGMDNLQGVRKWIKYQDLLATYPFIVMNRKGDDHINDIDYMFNDVKHNFTLIDFDDEISSTDAREYPKKRLSLLTKEVLKYINQNHLYKEPNNV